MDGRQPGIGHMLGRAGHPDPGGDVHLVASSTVFECRLLFQKSPIYRLSFHKRLAMSLRRLSQSSTKAWVSTWVGGGHDGTARAAECADGFTGEGSGVYADGGGLYLQVTGAQVPVLGLSLTPGMVRHATWVWAPLKL